jgi:protein O-mannosyl-transferase
MLLTNYLQDISRYVASFKIISKNRYLYIVLLALVTFIIFWQVIGYEFVKYDDDFTVYENTYLQSDTVTNIIHFWGNTYKDAYLPLTGTILAIETLFAKTTPSDSYPSGFNPAIFHASNLIFHILNAILVFLILRILIKYELASFFGALLFAIHPVQVESVAWVTGVKDVFSGFLSLFAIWQYLLYAQLSKKEYKTDQDSVRKDQDRKKKILHYLIAIVSFLLAILAKPTRVVVPIIAFTLDYLILKRQLRQVVISTAGWIAVAAPIIVATILLMPTPNEATFRFSLLERLLVSSDSLVFYLYKLVFPISLGPDYGRTIKTALSQKYYFIAPVVLALFILVVYALKKYRSWLLASAVIFIAGALPMLGFIRFQFQEISSVADRYLYLSILGPGIALAFFLSCYKKRPAIVICGVIMFVLAIFSFLQIQNWKDTVTLYNHALQVNPYSGTFHSNLGVFLAHQGKLDEAIYHFSEALKNHPSPSKVHLNIGNALTQQDKFDTAIYHFSEALKCNPNNAEAHSSLGYVLAQQGNIVEAIVNFHEALRLSPHDASAHTNLGIVLAQQGKFDEAVFHFSEVLKSDPHNAEAHTNLGIVLAQQGKFDEAVFHYSEASKLNPGFQDAKKNLIKAK